MLVKSITITKTVLTTTTHTKLVTMMIIMNITLTASHNK